MLDSNLKDNIQVSRRITGLNIDIKDFQMLLHLDAELDADPERTSLLYDQQRSQNVLRRMRLLIVVTSMGGFLSGYNTGVLSGVILPLARAFHLSAEQKELIVSVTIFFAFLSSIFGEKLNRSFGRRKTLTGAAAIFLVGAFVLLLAQNFFMLVVGETFVGIAIGIESVTSPMYIAEVAKPSMRGMLVSSYILLLCFGQFFAGIVDALLASFPMGWRFMYGFCCIPAAATFVGLSFLPESPSWLLSRGRRQEANAILTSIRDCDDDVMDEIQEIEENLRVYETDEQETTVSLLWEMLRNKATRNALVVGCGIMALQHKCGFNVVMYYSASIFEMTGFSEVTSIWLSALTSIAQIFGLALSVLLVESAGRRPLLLLSLSLVTLSTVGLGFSFYLARVASEPVHASVPECASIEAWGWSGLTQYCFDCVRIEGCGYCDGQCVRGDEFGPLDPTVCSAGSFEFEGCPNPYGYLSVIFMVLFLLTFGIGMSGLPWTVNSEIHVIKYRSIAVSISTATNWIMNLIVSATFLSFSDRLTPHRAFWVYAFMSGLGVIWLYFKLPETKGKSLEEITNVFAGRQPETRKKSVGYEMGGHTHLSSVLETKNSYSSINSDE
jgi:SP family myo-inositol transporter-like MFS transporter 13